MNVVVWVVSGVLAAVFLIAGIMKLTKSKDQLIANPAMGWASDFRQECSSSSAAPRSLAPSG